MALKGWNSCGRAEFTKTRPISQFTSFCSGVHERFKRAMPIAIRVAERAKIISASISMNLCPFSAPVAAYRVHSVTPYPRRLGRFCVALLAFAVPVPDFGEGYHPFGSTRAAGMSGRAALPVSWTWVSLRRHFPGNDLRFSAGCLGPPAPRPPPVRRARATSWPSASSPSAGRPA